LKYLVIVLASIATLVGCSQKSDLAEQRLKRYYIVHQMLRNRTLSAAIAEEAGLSQKARIRSLLGKLNEVSKLREQYLANQSIGNLVMYADGIMKGYDSMKGKDPQIITAMKSYHDEILNLGDSVSIENLYWHTLYAESQILEFIAHDTNFGDRMPTNLSISLSDSSFAPRDTVRVLVNTLKSWYPNEVDFSRVVCTNQQSGTDLVAKITRLKQYYLLEYFPKEKGNYLIYGPVMFNDGINVLDLRVESEFIVK
jgi:hypothetical protein